MAVLIKRRVLSNPGRTKRRAKNPRKMSLAQKLHFGSARQRAAARLSLRRKKNPSKRVKNAGPYSARKSKKATLRFGGRANATHAGKLYRLRAKTRKAAKRRKNVGEIVSISLAGLNPGRKRRKTNNMATRRRRRRSNAGTKFGRSWSTYTKRRKKNPGVRRRRRASAHRTIRRRRSNPSRVVRVYNRGRRRVMHRRRHSNPGVFSSGTLTSIVGVVGGLVASKYLTQLALGGNNKGYMGYAGNLVASIGLGWATGKVFKNKQLGQMVMYGGLAGLAARLLLDLTPIGQYVNTSLNGVGKGGDLGLGIIQDSSFPVPQTFAPGSMTNAIVPAATRAYVGAQTAQMAQAGSKGVAGMGSMMRGRAVRRAIM